MHLQISFFQIKPTLIGVAMVLLFAAVNAQPATAFQTEEVNLKEATESIKDAYEKIGEMVKKGQLEKATELMTKDSADTYIADLVTEAIFMTSPPKIDDLPGDIPEEFRKEIEEDMKRQFESQKETRVKVEELISKYGLKKFKEKKYSPMASDDLIEEMKSGILESLDKSDSRFKAAVEFKKLTGNYHLNLFNGELQKEIEFDGDVATLEVELNLDEMEMGDEELPDVEMEIMMPPLFIKFEKADKGWKFAGIDEEKTAEAEEEFMEEMNAEGGFGEPEPRRKSDFL